MNNNQINAAIAITTKLLKSYFTAEKKALICTPHFHITSNRIIVQFFYYVSPQSSLFKYGPLITIENKTYKALIASITHLYPNITVELQGIRQYQPYINADILAQYVAINASKYGFHRIMTILLNVIPYIHPQKYNMQDNTQSSLPSCITGIKIQLSGLLTSIRNPPRKTVYTAYAGTFHGINTNSNSLKNSSNTVIDYGYSAIPHSFNNKSRIGAFNVKVWLCSTT